jgi:spermidine/putrescine transport system substrate-binding protein
MQRRRQLMRIIESMLVVAVLGVAALGMACGSSEDSTIGGELHIYNWEDYFAPTTLDDFEAEFGVEVFLDTYDDEYAMASVVESDTSKYDVVLASGSLVAEMAERRLLAELDLGNIPNLANIDPEFLDQPWDPGNRHSVPYTWGSTGILYNTKYVDSPTESWSLLRDPSLAGRVALANDYAVVIGLTLKSLGYPLNSSDPDEIEEAVQVLRDQQPLLVGYLDYFEMEELILSEELWAAQVYNGDAAFLMEEYEDLAFFIPFEGADYYVDTLAIPRDAKNKAAAEAFLNYILRPEVHAEIGNYTQYATPNQAALEQGLIDEELLASEASYPPRALLEAWEPFDAEVLSLWNKAWADVQAAAGPPASE